MTRTQTLSAAITQTMLVAAAPAARAQVTAPAVAATAAAGSDVDPRIPGGHERTISAYVMAPRND